MRNPGDDRWHFDATDFSQSDSRSFTQPEVLKFRKAFNVSSIDVRHKKPITLSTWPDESDSIVPATL